MVCQNCGTQLPDGTPMCPTCGAQLQQAYADPNQVYNQPGAASSMKNNKTMFIGIAAAAVVAIVLVVVLLLGSSKYNGTYELKSVSMYGQEFTVKELEELSGEKIDATLTVKGKKCTLDAEFVGVKDASGKIKFDGDEVTIDDGSEVMKGDYDKDDKAIILEASGVEMKFVKE